MEIRKEKMLKKEKNGKMVKIEWKIKNLKLWEKR
jgi:hypothetical protein